MRKQSLTQTISFKLTEPEKKGFTDYCNKRGLSISEGLRELIVDTIELTPNRVDLLTLLKRVEALESIVGAKRSGQKPPPKRTIKSDPASNKNPDNFKDLITINEASEITGYSVSTLSSKFSRENISAKERIKGNRGGMYSKKEILNKIGSK